eukprot:1380790-Pleurochrysis_carterae.AAC.1
MTSCGTAYQLRGRCPAAFAWNSIARLRLGTGRWHGAPGQERSPAFWPVGLRRHGGADRLLPERGFCGRMMGRHPEGICRRVA